MLEVFLFSPNTVELPVYQFLAHNEGTRH